MRTQRHYLAGFTGTLSRCVHSLHGLAQRRRRTGMLHAVNTLLTRVQSGASTIAAGRVSGTGSIASP